MSSSHSQQRHLCRSLRGCWSSDPASKSLALHLCTSAVRPLSASCVVVHDSWDCLWLAEIWGKSGEGGDSRSPWHGNPITYHFDGALHLIDGGDDLLKTWQSHCLRKRADKESGG